MMKVFRFTLFTRHECFFVVVVVEVFFFFERYVILGYPLDPHLRPWNFSGFSNRSLTNGCRRPVPVMNHFSLR